VRVFFSSFFCSSSFFFDLDDGGKKKVHPFKKKKKNETLLLRWLTMVLASTLTGDSTYITHGPTYMTPITPRSPYWNDLPGSPGSVPDLVGKCGHQV
jgi:hypothetical protein